jgi:hypothetical protein
MNTHRTSRLLLGLAGLLGTHCTIVVEDGDYAVDETRDARADDGGPAGHSFPDSGNTAPTGNPEAGDAAPNGPPGTGTEAGSDAGKAPVCTPQPSDSLCSQCGDTQCCAERTACKDSPACVALNDCEYDCNGDNACTAVCNTQYPNAVPTLHAWYDCSDNNCAICAEYGVGDTCTTDSDCISGLQCDLGVCTKTCTTDSDCAGIDYSSGLNQFGEHNYCLLSATNKSYCFAGCALTATCAHYSDMQCIQVPDISGVSVPICSYVAPPTDAGVKIGAPSGASAVAPSLSTRLSRLLPTYASSH